MLSETQKKRIVSALAFAFSESNCSRSCEYKDQVAWFDSLSDDCLIGEYKDQYGEDELIKGIKV